DRDPFGSFGEIAEACAQATSNPEACRYCANQSCREGHSQSDQARVLICLLDVKPLRICDLAACHQKMFLEERRSCQTGHYRRNKQTDSDNQHMSDEEPKRQPAATHHTLPIR